jgi:hypothetical protein
METKINDQIKESLLAERDTHYIFSDDFFKEVDGITEKEDERAKKFMSIIGSDKDDKEEIMFVIQPNQLYHFLIRVQRQVLLDK